MIKRPRPPSPGRRALRRAADPAPSTAPAAPSLSEPYTPAPPPPEPLCVPLPAGWYDEPGYVLRPFAVAGAADPAPGVAPPRQLGTLGRCTRAGEKIAVDYDDCFAHAYFAPPRFGKTYVRGVHIENATLRTPYLNVLPAPLCAVSFHYEQGESHPPDLLASVRQNREPREVSALLHDYGSLPQGLRDVLCLTLPAQVPAHRARYPQVQTLALRLCPADLGLVGLRHLMGFPEDDGTLHGAQLDELLRALPAPLTLGAIEAALASFPFHSEAVRRALLRRFALARPYLSDDCPPLRAHVRPGRTLIVDLRDGWLPADKAVRLLCTVNYALLMGGAREALPCNLLLCFDEVHRLCRHRALREQLEHIVRERRHLRASVIVLSQDPLSVPRGLLSLLDVVGVFRTDAQAWIDALGRQIAAFRGLDVAHFTGLPAGQLLLWARQWWEASGGRELHGGLVQLRVRPRLSQHGGQTFSAAGPELRDG